MLRYQVQVDSHLLIFMIDMGALVGTKGQCLDDQFAISVPGGQSTNVICGKNTGEHCKYLFVCGYSFLNLNSHFLKEILRISNQVGNVDTNKDLVDLGH